MTDVKTKTSITLTKQKDFIPGYNYISNYKKLYLCEEGQVYNNFTNTCDGKINKIL
jgi:hypothetical protein